MKIEPSVANVRNHPTNILCFGVAGSHHLVMPEISDLLVPLRPLPPRPVPQKGHLEENERTTKVHHQEQSPTSLPSRHPTQRNQLKKRHQVEPLRLFPVLNGNYDNLQENVEESGQRGEQFLDDPLQKSILWQYPQIVGQWLNRLYLVIQQRIREGMVAETVHALPLLMRETSDQPQITKGMPSHVDEIVSHPQKRKE